MNKKFEYILEIVWLVVAILSLITGIYATFNNGFSDSYLFYIFCAIATFMYFFRRYLRKLKTKIE